MPATDKQIRDLEQALNTQFYYLVQGAAFRIAIARKFGLGTPEFKKFNAVFVPLVSKWIQRDVKYERANLKKGIKGIIASGDLKANDFYYSAQLPKLDALVKKWSAEPSTGTMGWVGILIWSIAIIASLFTAATIVDDLTTTTQEREELLKTTRDTAKELGLTPEQAMSLITTTQKEASKGTGFQDLLLPLGIIAAAGVILPIMFKKDK